MDHLLDYEEFPGKLLHQAALWDNYELLIDLLKSDQKSLINCQDDVGRTPIHAAVLSKDSKCLKLLLQFGANVNLQCNARGKRNTALHVCAENGYESNIETLLEFGADATIKNIDGFTSADVADKCGHFDCSKILRKAAHNREHYRFENYTKLSESCKNESIIEFKSLLDSINQDVELIINLAPNGSNTLLFTACEVGKGDIVQLLLTNGADGRCHPVTKYSPLYIACYHGRIEIVEILLNTFPEMIQQPTFEKWLPIHAACMKGHSQLVHLLLNFSHPISKMLYSAAFNLNFLDVNGQSVLYILCILGNKELVEVLLHFRIPVLSKSTDFPEKLTPVPSNIKSIMSRLTKEELPGDRDDEDNQEFLSPILIDQYCNQDTETALHAAVKGKFYDIALLLLQSSANVNLPIKTNASDEDSSNCLVEACKNKDVAMMDLLLKFGARDDDCKALNIAVQNKDDVLISKLLSTKAYPDPDLKINKKQMTENIHSNTYFLKANSNDSSSLTYSSMFPNVPTMINWHNLKSNLNQINKQWLLDAITVLNPKLKQNLRSEEIAFFAITRLDLSGNSICTVPIIVFQLGSLKSLNLSQNKIEQLPHFGAKNSTCKDNKYKRSQSVEGRRFQFRCPVLEELYLQDNRLEFVPESIFELPSLVTLNVSNNKLQTLPNNIWNAPKLRELNVSFNLLKELPILQKQVTKKVVISYSEGNLSKFLKKTKSINFDQGLKTFSNTESKSAFLESHEIKKHHLWTNQIEINDQILHFNDDNHVEKTSLISSLNLSHNLFTNMPPMLACLSPKLSKLNLSYNSLRNMAFITSYPHSLKQLDLSHNHINSWPTLPQMGSQDIHMQTNLLCYCEFADKKFPLIFKDDESSSYRNILLKCICPHRRHLRLDSLKILVLADNNINHVQILSDDIHGDFSMIEDEEISEKASYFQQKSKLLFPNVSMLDLSNNCLKEIPKNIYELPNLSIFNISGNRDITDLPIQMGLLTHLWNLNTTGCNLQEPLKSMIASNKYKTMDIIGYLKSVLEDARPYARMKLMLVGIQGIGKTSLLELLRQEGLSKKKYHEHWSVRVANKNANFKTPKGTNLSTVGVDIGDWIYEKKVKNSHSFGPVIFRTWDFGGQKEYYATHQYFLSKRSLYLVIWKILDGHKGINEIYKWLVNIQARAPNSPVIIVGTHHDMLPDCSSTSEVYQKIIRDKFINVVDAEKSGLPKVLDSVEISCKTKHNIKLLCNLIYDTVFSLKQPGSKELMLQQRVPVTYLLLEDVVNQIAANRKANNLDPVLDAETFRNIVIDEINSKYNRTFRDLSELHQATMFLHENGVLLHYDDSTLKNLYFLDPQWLCDMLAHVVTIREINPFARNGIMKMDDLQLIFKSNTVNVTDPKSYIINLLTKFEVALTWDSRTLLIPSLLPTENECFKEHFDRVTYSSQLVKISLKLSKAWNKIPENNSFFIINRNTNETEGLIRFYSMTYFPSGFWSRLISRILADDSIISILKNYFIFPNNVKNIADFKTEWILWQSGLQLNICNDVIVLRVREISADTSSNVKNLKFLLKNDFSWNSVDNLNQSLLEIYVPYNSLVIKDHLEDDDKSSPLSNSLQSRTKLLVFLIDHIDTLLEDWYPMLGTRFIHTSEGKCLITRIVPCTKCFFKAYKLDSLNLSAFTEDHEIRLSQESYSSDKDSGVGREIENVNNLPTLDGLNVVSQIEQINVYCWTVEECILESLKTKVFCCPNHGSVHLENLAPETIFMDLDSKFKIVPTFIKKGALLGRGAFGFVFKATLKLPHDKVVTDVAMKMLQPVHPGISSRNSAIIAYKAAQQKWDRDPLQYACKSYCTSRQELNILLNLQHTNIVTFIGVCANPLALILDLAPLGDLHSVLRNFRRSGAQISYVTLHAILLQIAKSLEYLHRNKIIYRDLKSENVLVWEMPSPFQKSKNQMVLVKLADYGISRLSCPYGTKGFGGTEGFMAPEIMKYNGEEEYTEKVDIFSFGMFIYELITLHPPFEAYESFKDLVLQGCRPALTNKQIKYPCYFLDLMTICWPQLPKDRPTSSQIVSILSAPEFLHLYDVMSMSHQSPILSVFHSPAMRTSDGVNCCELWSLCSNFNVDILVCKSEGWSKYYNFKTENRPTVGCIIDNCVVIGDDRAQIHVYSLQTGSKLFDYDLEPENYKIVSVVGLFYVEQRKLIICGLSNSRILLLNVQLIETKLLNEHFIINELSTSTMLFSFCLIYRPTNIKLLEIWCNESDGKIGIFLLEDNVRIDKNTVLHNEPFIENIEVINLISSKEKVWSFINPGYILYQWNVVERKILAKLDCSKMIPCSESLKSISIEDHLSPGKCQITSITNINNEIYIGTTWGCIIVAECNTLRPISIFRPYEYEVRAVHPVWVPNKDNDNDNDNDNNDEMKLKPMLVTIGKGYRSLFARYLDIHQEAPELLLGSKNYGLSIDMWSAGCIMAEMYLEMPILPGTSTLNQLNRIINLLGTLSPDVWPGVTSLEGYHTLPYTKTTNKHMAHYWFTLFVLKDTAIDLIEKLLVLDPEQRLTAEDAQNHDFFNYLKKK